MDTKYDTGEWKGAARALMQLDSKVAPQQTQLQEAQLLHNALLDSILKHNNPINMLTSSNEEGFTKFATETIPSIIDNAPTIPSTYMEQRYRTFLRHGRIGIPHARGSRHMIVTPSSQRSESGIYMFHTYCTVVKQMYDAKTLDWIPCEQKERFRVASVINMVGAGTCSSRYGYGDPKSVLVAPGTHIVKGKTYVLETEPVQAWNTDVLSPGIGPWAFSLVMRTLHHSRIAHSTSTISMHIVHDAHRFANTGAKRKGEYYPLQVEVPYFESMVPIVPLMLALDMDLSTVSWIFRTCFPDWNSEDSEFLRSLIKQDPIQTTRRALIYLTTLTQKKSDWGANPKFHVQNLRRKPVKMCDMVDAAAKLYDPDEPPAEGHVDTEEEAKARKNASFALEEKIRGVRKTLFTELFNHILDGPIVLLEKAIELARKAYRLLRAKQGKTQVDDRDHPLTKRRHSQEVQFANMYRSILYMQMRHIASMTYRAEITKSKPPEERVPPDFYEHFRSGRMSSQMTTCFTTRNWTAVNSTGPQKGPKRSGMIELLKPKNSVSVWSALSKMRISVQNLKGNSTARNIHPLEYGRTDGESSDSKQGQSRSRVPTCKISNSGDPQVVIDVLSPFVRDLGIITTQHFLEALRQDQSAFAGKLQVNINARLYGWIPEKNVDLLVAVIRKLRRTRNITSQIEVAMRRSYFQNEDSAGKPNKVIALDIWVDHGRLLRPVIVFERYRDLLELTRRHEQGRLLYDLSLPTLLNMGIVEYLGMHEEDTLVNIALGPVQLAEKLALGQQVTHVELHNSLSYGMNLGLTPRPEHNMGPRNTFSGNMRKATVSATQSELVLGERVQHTLSCTQLPLVTTALERSLPIDDRCMGVNAVVDVGPFEGWNVEDAVAASQGFVDRMGLNSALESKVSAQDGQANASSASNLSFKIPDPRTCANLKSNKYQAMIDPVTCCVRPGRIVRSNDPLIALVLASKLPGSTQAAALGKKVYEEKDNSIIYKGPDARVEDVKCRRNDSTGISYREVHLREIRIPEIGDKFASRHGQKGVAGLIVPDHDMPFAADGTRADIVINTWGYPSRGTAGMTDEALQAKARAIDPDRISEDGTAFSGTTAMTMERAKAILREHSMPTEEVLYHPHTGERIEGTCYRGLVYYSRLQQQTIDKVQGRSSGPRSIRTRQPTEGKARDGSVRTGEMERDCFVAAGASYVLNEAQVQLSDPFGEPRCEECGYPAVVNWKDKVKYCKLCNKTETVCWVPGPFAWKQYSQITMGMGGVPRVSLQRTGTKLKEMPVRVYSV